MRNKTYVGYFALLLVIGSLLVLVGGWAAVGQGSPYLSGLWLQKGVHQDGSICWTLIDFNNDLTGPGVSGTGLGTAAIPMEIPTPEGGTMTVAEEMRATWKMNVPSKYDTKVLAFLRSEGMVIGMVELTGVLVRESEDKMSTTWHTRVVDLDGNELKKLPPVEAELTRISVD